MDPIKDMKLYTHLERVDRELKAQGKEDGSKLEPGDLYKFDHMNYYGTDAVANGIKMCNLNDDSLVLDLGSGLGGPARFIATESGANVVALELQEDCSKKALEYTTRCGISKISHVCADFISCDLEEVGLAKESLDAIMSWLVILHIDEKQKLFDRCASLSKKGGYLYVEDFFMKNDFNPDEKESLKNDVYCSTLETRDDYVKTLERAGYEVLAFDVLTDSWTDFVTKRKAAYIAVEGQTKEKHGVATYESQLYFFSAIEKLFKGNNLGGCRIVAKRQ